MFLETERLQHTVQILGRSGAVSLVGFAGRAFKITLVKIHYARRRVRRCDRRGFENFVIQGDGQFFIA